MALGGGGLKWRALQTPGVMSDPQGVRRWVRGQSRPSLRRWNWQDWTLLGKGRTWAVSGCLAWALVILQTEHGMRVEKGS